jgi:ribonuclease D
MASREEGPLFLRFKGAARLPPRTLAVLEELLRFRDAQAQQADLPPFRILYPETVASLAERRPRHPAELARVPGLSGEARQRLGSGILAAVERGLAVPEGQLPRYPSVPRPARDRRKDERFQRLKDWRREKAAALALDPGVLANSALLEALAALPAGAEPGTAIPRRWQRELFGAEVAALLA